MVETVQAEEESLEVTLDENNDVVQEEQQIAVEETTETQEASSDANEIEEYSDSVQKRINKLTYKIREAERREKAAIEYAQNVQGELNSTKEKLSLQDKNLYDEYSARVSSELTAAENKLKQAYEMNDSEAIIEAQKSLATLSVEQESLNRVKPTKDETEKEVQVESVENTEIPSAQRTPEPDPKAVAWADKNEWFGKDVAMTSTAFAFHNQLIRDEGFDPTSDDYYAELDKRIVDAFPHKFDGSAPQKNVQDVVAVSSKGARSTKKARTVRLTPSQLSIAKRLGVSPEEYAKHVKT
jgi:hypothetical protein|tara:strand:+ start:8636 stop:9526 length:891 start_codon:yes stop_codon:yes gene_type:complete